MASIDFVPSRTGTGGSYRVRFRLDGKPQQVGRFATQDAAGRFAALIEEIGAAAALKALKGDDTAKPQPRTTTLRELCEQHRETDRTASAATKANRKTFTNSLPAYLADVPALTITRDTIERWLEDEIRKGRVHSTRKTRLTYVRARLRDAVKTGLLPRDPSEGVTIRRTATATALRRDVVALTADDFHTILGTVDDDDARFVLRLIAGCGLRPSEALALTTLSVVGFPNNPRLTITASLSKDGTLQPPKSRNSTRQVPLPASLHDAVKQRMVEASGGYLVSRDTEPYPYYLFQKRIEKSKKRWARKHGYRWLPYDFRRFYITTLINSGTPPQVVASLAGHTVAMTLNIYAGTIGKARDETAETINNALGVM